ncbi:MAG: DUF4238 domain-containing protein, partial [Candidatus Nitrosotenuis sp.]
MNQHYVPQFLLRKFIPPGKNILYVFDKPNGNSFPANPRNISAEKEFYEYDFNGEIYSMDKHLTLLESSASPIINKIIENESLSPLNDADRRTLSIFIAVQSLRTKRVQIGRA